ncbi:MAG: site-specific integrase [Candidatus Brocadia sp.]|nr:site-specific integrase [Candidatus Brocadia sp.]
MPLNEKAKEILTVRNKSRSIKSNFVFYNKYGNKIVSSNLGRSFRSVVKKAGIEKFRFHDLGHTFATRLIQNDIDIYTVQRLGRWKSMQVVMRYAHHHAESLRCGAEVLDKLENKFIAIV